MSTYDPNSTDAVLSRILAELGGLRDDFKSFREDSEKQIRSLQESRNFQRGTTAVISTVVSAGVVALFEWFTSSHKP